MPKEVVEEEDLVAVVEPAHLEEALRQAVPIRNQNKMWTVKRKIQLIANNQTNLLAKTGKLNLITNG